MVLKYYSSPGISLRRPAGVNYPDKKVPIPDTPGYPFTTGLLSWLPRTSAQLKSQTEQFSTFSSSSVCPALHSSPFSPLKLVLMAEGVSHAIDLKNHCLIVREMVDNNSLTIKGVLSKDLG